MSLAQEEKWLRGEDYAVLEVSLGLYRQQESDGLRPPPLRIRE
jgi:hypothetical protein